MKAMKINKIVTQLILVPLTKPLLLVTRNVDLDIFPCPRALKNLFNDGLLNRILTERLGGFVLSCTIYQGEQNTKEEEQKN